MVWCICRRTVCCSSVNEDLSNAEDDPPASLCKYACFQSLFRNLNAPSTPLSDHSRDCSGGAANMINKRTVSAPYSSINPCGSTVLPLDLDILLPSFSTMPCVNNFLKGSSQTSKPSSRINLV